MKRLCFFLCLFFYFPGLLPANAQGINQNLKSKLDSIMHIDQTLRALYDSNTSPARKNEILEEFGYTQAEFQKRHWRIVAEHDSLNLAEVEDIIRAHGYPGKSLVGEPTNEAAWYVLQHSNQIEKYFPWVKKRET